MSKLSLKFINIKNDRNYRESMHFLNMDTLLDIGCCQYCP